MDQMPTINHNDTKKSDYILSKDLNTIFKMTPSGEIMPSFAPNALAMLCVWTSSRCTDITSGEITIDYFNQEFYGPFTKEQIEKIIPVLKP